LSTEWKFRERSLDSAKPVKNSLWEIEKVLGFERYETGPLKQTARLVRGEKFRVNVNRTSPDNRPRYGIPRIVLNDEAQSPRL
jgi:hypothetical protein